MNVRTAYVFFLILALPILLWGQASRQFPQDYPETTTYAVGDQLLIVTTPATKPTTQKITAGNLLMRRGGCTIAVGNDKSGSAVLVNADLSQADQCQVPNAATLLEISVKANSGAPSVIVSRLRPNGALSVPLLSPALSTGSDGSQTCARGVAGQSINGITNCSATLINPNLSAGDWIYLASGTADGVATRMSISVIWAWN